MSDDRAQAAAAAYERLRAACRGLHGRIEAGAPLEQCQAEAEALAAELAALPEPQSLAGLDQAELEPLRAGLAGLAAVHRELAVALRGRMARERDGVAADHRRGEALRAYQGGRAVRPRFHDRRG